MRIAVVSPYALDAFGGVQDQVALLVGRLRRSGHDAWAVAPGGGGPAGTRHVGRATSVRANRARAPITLDPRAARRVREAIAGAEVVHVHEPLMPVAATAALRAGVAPVVATFHAAPGPLVRAFYRGAAPLLRRLIGRAAVVTAVSGVAADAVRRFARPRIVPNGIDTAAYEAPGSPTSGRVAFVGRDDPRKGLDVLLEAWPAVRAAAPGAELRVVGADRPEGPDGVTFLGRVSEDAKRVELAAAAVLCAPNLGGESFGIVIAEGMAAGCAVVASDLPAFRSVLGDAGLLVPAADPEELAAALVGLLCDPKEVDRLGRSARAAVRRFDIAVVADAYLHAYRDAVAASGTG